MMFKNVPIINNGSAECRRIDPWAVEWRRRRRKQPSGMSLTHGIQSSFPLFANHFGKLSKTRVIYANNVGNMGYPKFQEQHSTNAEF